MIIGIGVDIINIDRIRNLRKRYPRFEQKIFTQNEIEYCLAKADPAISLSARFAAKEAAVKALGVGISKKIGWKNIEITNNSLGQPQINIIGKGFEFIENKKVTRIHLSLSHDHDHALAFCMMEGK